MLGSLCTEGLTLIPSGSSAGGGDTALTWESLTFAMMMLDGLGDLTADLRCIADACSYLETYSRHFARFRNMYCLSETPLMLTILTRMSDADPGRPTAHTDAEVERNNEFHRQWVMLLSTRTALRAQLPEAARALYGGPTDDWCSPPDSPLLHNHLQSMMNTFGDLGPGHASDEKGYTPGASLISSLDAFRRAVAGSTPHPLPADVFFTGRSCGTHTVLGRDGMGNGAAGVAPILATLGLHEVVGVQGLLADATLAAHVRTVMASVSTLLRLKTPMVSIDGGSDDGATVFETSNSSQVPSAGQYVRQSQRPRTDSSRGPHRSLWFLDAPSPEDLRAACRKIKYLFSSNSLLGNAGSALSSHLEATPDDDDEDIARCMQEAAHHHSGRADVLLGNVGIYNRFFHPQTVYTVLELAHAYDALLGYETKLYGYIASIPVIDALVGPVEQVSDEEPREARRARGVSAVTEMRDRLVPTLLSGWVELLPMVDIVVDVVLKNADALAALSNQFYYGGEIGDVEAAGAPFDAYIASMRQLRSRTMAALGTDTEGDLGLVALGRVLMDYLRLVDVLYCVVHGTEHVSVVAVDGRTEKYYERAKEMGAAIATLLADAGTDAGAGAGAGAVSKELEVLFAAAEVHGQDLGLVFAPVRQEAVLAMREEEVTACIEALSEIILSDDIMPAFAYGFLPDMAEDGKVCVKGRVELSTEAGVLVQQEGVRGAHWALGPRILSSFHFLINGAEATESSLNSIFSMGAPSPSGKDEAASGLLVQSLRHRNSKLKLPKQRSLYASPQLRKLLTTWRVLSTNLHMSHDGFPTTDFLSPAPVNMLQMYVDPVLRQRMVDLHVFWQYRLLLQRFKHICFRFGGDMLANNFQDQTVTISNGESLVERGQVQLVLVAEFTDLDAVVRAAAYLKEQFLLSTADGDSDDDDDSHRSDRSFLTTAETLHYVDLVFSLFQWRSEALHALMQKNWPLLRALTCRKSVQHFEVCLSLLRTHLCLIAASHLQPPTAN
jgi:hypothetical protein